MMIAAGAGNRQNVRLSLSASTGSWHDDARKQLRKRLVLRVMEGRRNVIAFSHVIRVTIRWTPKIHFVIVAATHKIGVDSQTRYC
jgi:hypothetical protein